MKVLFGATGMAGQGVLREALAFRAPAPNRTEHLGEREGAPQRVLENADIVRYGQALGAAIAAPADAAGACAVRAPKNARLWFSLFLALLLTAGCGGSKSATSPSASAATLPPATVPSPSAAADFGGMWAGTWVVDSTTIAWAHRGIQREFRLRLRPVGGRVEGYVVTQSAANDVLTGFVAGNVLPDFRLRLEGSTPEAGANDHHGAVTFRLELWFQSGELRGAVDYEVHRFGPGIHYTAGAERSAGALTSASRVADPSGTFEGTWRGRYLVRSCDAAGWSQCYSPTVGDVYQVELVLTQSGGLVTGTVWPDFSDGSLPQYRYVIEASGNAAGNALTLTGTSERYPTNPNATRRLLAMSVVRDALGRLSGSFTWQEDFVGNGPANLGQLYRTTRSGDLYSVVQLQ